LVCSVCQLNIEMRAFIIAAVAVLLLSAGAVAHGSEWWTDVPPEKWQDLAHHTRAYHRATAGIVAAGMQFGRAGAANATKCLHCQKIGGDIIAVFESPTLVNVTEDVLLSECAKLPKKDLEMCKIVVDVIMFIGVKVTHELAHNLKFNLPNIICADVLKLCVQPCCSVPFTPEQIRLNFASRQVLASETAMQVSWVTLQATPGATVQYRAVGASEWSSPGTENTTTYHLGGWVGVIHTAVMTGLTPATTYTYRVGSVAHGQSPIINFRTLPLNAGTAERPLRVFNVADMGTENSEHTIATMTQMVNNGSIDFVLHPGDIGYADGDEPRWDVFNRLMQPVMSRVAYMTGPGNHECPYNFTAYRHRYQMQPVSEGYPTDAMYYHFYVGPVAFVMVDSETFIDTPDIDPVEVRWIKATLAEANAQKSFVVVAQHRPLYASERSKHDNEHLRKQIEQVYIDQKVDLVTCGHLHNYERTLPLKNGAAASSNYTFPTAPVYVINGAAGNREGQHAFHDMKPWSVLRTEDVGFVVMDFRQHADKTIAMNSKFIQSRTHELIDEFTLLKKSQ
jgi:hypothetical protein